MRKIGQALVFVAWAAFLNLIAWYLAKGILWIDNLFAVRTPFVRSLIVFSTHIVLAVAVTLMAYSDCYLKGGKR